MVGKGHQFTLEIDDATLKRILDVHADRPESQDVLLPETATDEEVRAADEASLALTVRHLFDSGLRQSEREIEEHRRWMEQEQDDSDIPF